MEKRYAEIIIDISVQALDHIFTYVIPEQLENQVTVGCQVEIPFGKGDHLRKGYVMALKSEAGYEESRIKAIHSVILDASLVEGQMLKLAYWIKEQYGSTLIQALLTVLPCKIKMTTKQESFVNLMLSKEEAQKLITVLQQKHHVAKVRLLQALLQQPVLEKSYVTGSLKIAASTLRSLTQEGVIALSHTRRYRNPCATKSGILPQHELNAEQRKAYEIFAADYDAQERRTYLLHGVTGSGKTEVYMAMIAHVIQKKQQAIVLIPEIALTYQTVRRFANRFGDQVTVIHSKLSKGERYDQFERAKKGEVSVVIGPRSALFVPFPDLGLIIVDEEHESSYKSEQPPKYHARETAIARAQLAGASVVLGSATPSVESYEKALQGQYKLLTMQQRAADAQLPEVVVVDMRQELQAHNFSMFSRELKTQMQECLKRKEQIMLFINRRGYAGFVSCRKCGYVVKCSHCDVALKLHGKNRLVCHYCGYEQEIPKVCPECGSQYIRAFGTGTEKVEEQLKKEFPFAKVLRMDADTTRKKGQQEAILQTFASQQADILIGTQMIVKGHDFPNVTLVGALAADLSLFEQDFRSAEKTFDLLTQAAGRAGRGEKKGKMIIQTYQPQQYSITAAAKQDYGRFFQQEKAFRRLMQYPPFCHMLVVFMANEKEERLAEATRKIYRQLSDSKAPQMMLIGPSEAGIYKMNDIYRKVIYVKHTSYVVLVQLKNIIDQYWKEYGKENRTRIYFDFDPMNMY